MHIGNFFEYARMYVARMNVHLCSGIKCMFFLCVHNSVYVQSTYTYVNVRMRWYSPSIAVCNAVYSYSFFSFSSFMFLYSFFFLNNYCLTLNGRRRNRGDRRRASLNILKYIFFSVLFNLQCNQHVKNNNIYIYFVVLSFFFALLPFPWSWFLDYHIWLPL